MSGHIKAWLQALFDSATKTLRGFVDLLGNEISGIPYILAQSAVPVILLPAGTVNGSGQFTLGTALPYTPSGVVAVYVFAGVGLAAGLYQATFSANNVCQIAGNPATTAGAYAGGTGIATLASITVPSGAMGPNGSIRHSLHVQMSNTAGNKTYGFTLGGVNTVVYGTSASSAGAGVAGLTVNRGAPNSQMSYLNTAYGSGSGGASTSLLNVDTSQAQQMTVIAQIAVATDYIILEGYTVEILPGA